MGPGFGASRSAMTASQLAPRCDAGACGTMPSRQAAHPDEVRLEGGGGHVVDATVA